jgi:hypothetical protein
MTKAIDTFLENWKQSAFTYHMANCEKFIRLSKEAYETSKNENLSFYERSYSRSFGDFDITLTENSRHRKIMTMTECEEKFGETASFKAWKESTSFKRNLTGAEVVIIERLHFEIKQGNGEQYLNNLLDKEVEKKRIALIKRIEKKPDKSSTLRF